MVLALVRLLYCPRRLMRVRGSLQAPFLFGRGGPFAAIATAVFVMKLFLKGNTGVMVAVLK